MFKGVKVGSNGTLGDRLQLYSPGTPPLLRFLLKVTFDVTSQKLSRDMLTLKAAGYELKWPLL